MISAEGVCVRIMNSYFCRIKRGTRRAVGGWTAARARGLHFAKGLAVFGLVALVAGPVSGAAAEPAAHTDRDATAKYRAWIAQMKDERRGPFDQIRWFCKDGTRLLPTPSACKPHGGGFQHGQWSAHTLALREAGYLIANFYADLDVDALLKSDPTFSPLAQLAIEQFLIRADDGWILRQARFYRGAYQEENERAGARVLLKRLLEESAWLAEHFLLVRTLASALPHGPETADIRGVRQLAATLSQRDGRFMSLRNKIHGRMTPGDAASVRQYAAGLASGQEDFERLARMIDGVYATDSGAALRELATALPESSALRAVLTSASSTPADDARTHAAALARTLAALRDGLGEVSGTDLRLKLLDASLAVEAEYTALLGRLNAETAGWTRRARLEHLGEGTDALYGTGMLSHREREALRAEIAGLTTTAPSPAAFKKACDYLALMPHWATQRYRLQFGLALDKLQTIEPKTALFVQDALRGSPLFFHAVVADTLVRDANRARGVRNELMGEDVGGGLRGLNPGLARGVLHFAAADGAVADYDRNGIYVLPETVSDLPPVAGILTAGEGNPLSHVQLLARNLGIPNVALEARLSDRLRPLEGKEILLAVSPGGSVRVAEIDAQMRALFDSGPKLDTRPVIAVDLAKLDLTRRDFINLAELRAGDSGRIVGPKAAKLGELKHHYPAAVANGVAIPFGVFRAVLDQPLPGSTISIFAWMQTEYARLAALPADSDQRRTETESFRARLESLISQIDPGPAFRTALRAKLEEVLGARDDLGVFVRSDTNVEDLPGFTGAGLNLTLPNVVGLDNIFTAIAKVWASPFSARSFAWRQSLMTTPEHVYPAVLLLQSVDNDKSGVLVTHDIDTGDRGWLSVALNEGVGGAVDGQSAESVRIRTSDATIRLLAQASAPLRRQLAPTGGIALLPVHGSDAVLQPDEARLLVELAAELPQKFPPIVDAAGNPAPADIEFGFLRGALHLFQIRPFLDNAKARGASYLTTMDAQNTPTSAATIDLEQAP